MNKAVFLDRDGVINDNSGHYYVFNPDDFILNSDVLESISILKKSGYLIFIISNQGGISKGIYTKNDADIIHDKLNSFMKANESVIDEIYYCPHHSDIENCFCRKPDSIMIEKLIARYNIDVKRSFLIGDSERDILAGEKVGLKSFLIEPNSGILNLCKSILLKE